MTSDIQTDRQTYILPLVVLSAALQQKTVYNTLQDKRKIYALMEK